MGIGGCQFDKPKDHMGGNRATVFVMNPSTERKVQSIGQQRSAVLAEQLLAYLSNPSGERHSPITILFHGDHPSSATWGRQPKTIFEISRPVGRRWRSC